MKFAIGTLGLGWVIGNFLEGVEDWQVRTLFFGWLGSQIFFSTVITDPMDSKFDLEAYLTMKMADEAK